jgi:ParB family chromosome partitioning protein
MSKQKSGGLQKPEVEMLPVEALIPYARNARTHSDEQVAQVAASIREFGFTNPVLVSAENDIIAGHGRVMAARKLGLEKVPCIRLAHLTETQRRAYVLADNKLALNSGWDELLLENELKELSTLEFDATLLGWTQAEISNLFLEKNFEPGTEDEQGKLDQKSSVICPKCTHEFFT